MFRSSLTRLSCVAMALLCGLSARAHYAYPEIENVPTARLIANLEKRLAGRLVESSQYQVGEELKIWSWNPGGLNGDFVVNTNGSIQIPQIGAVKVAGRTREDLMLQLNGTADSRDKQFKGIFVEQSWHQRKGRLLPGEAAELHYELARVYSIAYSQNPWNFQALKGGDRPFLGFGAGANLPPDRNQFRSAGPVSGTSLEQSDEQSKTNLQAAVQHFREALSRQTNHLGAQIGLGWCLDQQGKKTPARQAYERALDLAWQKEKGQDHILETSYVEEIINYLRPLLDPVKDSTQLAKLDGYAKSIQAKGRAITPILFPLAEGCDFGQLVNPSARVAFDLDGSGLPRRWGWITPRAAWLVYDPANRGQITSGLQLFGNATFWVCARNGYEALGHLDDSQDGWLQGAELKGLAAWQDRNSNGICEPGEVRPLTELGVTGLATTFRTSPDGLLFNPQGARFQDGSSRPTYDWIVRCAGE